MKYNMKTNCGSQTGKALSNFESFSPSQSHETVPLNSASAGLFPFKSAGIGLDDVKRITKGLHRCDQSSHFTKLCTEVARFDMI
jgi:hypothetical protein